MKKLLFIFTFVLLCSTSAYSQALEALSIVNDTPISNYDLEGRIDLMITSGNLPSTQEMRQQIARTALVSLIDDTLKIQEASRLGIDITPSELSNATNTIAQQNNLTGEQLKSILAKQPGVLESFENQLRAQISWSEIIKQKIRPQINISEDDIDRFIAEQREDAGKTQFNYSEVFLRIDRDRTEKQAQQLLEKIIQSLNDGRPFEAVATQFSDGIEASNGGLVGWVTDGQGDAVIQATLKRLNVGQTSVPVRSQYGVHLVRLNDKRKVEMPKNIDPEYQIEKLHIPVTSDQENLLNAKLYVANKIREKATNCQSMKDLASVYGTELSGDAGYIALSQLPRKLQSALEGLKLHQASKPIIRESGITIMMLCDKRAPENVQKERDQIANKLGTDRMNRLQDRYFRDLKTAAYITFNE